MLSLKVCYGGSSPGSPTFQWLSADWPSLKQARWVVRAPRRAPINRGQNSTPRLTMRLIPPPPVYDTHAPAVETQPSAYSSLFASSSFRNLPAAVGATVTPRDAVGGAPRRRAHEPAPSACFATGRTGASGVCVALTEVGAKVAQLLGALVGDGAERASRVELQLGAVEVDANREPVACSDARDVRCRPREASAGGVRGVPTGGVRGVCCGC